MFTMAIAANFMPHVMDAEMWILSHGLRLDIVAPIVKLFIFWS